MTDSSGSGTWSQSNHRGTVNVDPVSVRGQRAGSGPAPARPLPAGLKQAHEAAVASLQQAYTAVPPGTKVRLAKRTSNLFRFRDQPAGSRVTQLDVSAFSRVLHVDPESRTAVVGGMTTYEDLADATLRHGLMPFVVPQLKTITLGGAVTGLGIESTSLRLGMPHESVLAMEILTGDGQVVTATADNEHADLFRGFPNSYGTLGYALSLTIELEPVAPFVHLRHFRFHDPETCMEAIAKIGAEGSYEGHRADFVDGTMFSLDELYLTVGAFSEVAPWTSDYAGHQIFYQSLRGRSDVYRSLVAFDRRHGLSGKLAQRRGQPPREDVIQDVEIPVGRGAEFLRFFAADVGMSPVWLCPLRLRSDQAWPLYPLAPGEVYVNFGFWGTVPLPQGRADGYHNRLVEDEVAALGGHKGLYSTSFYTEEQFWASYNGPAYAALKQRYDGGGRLAGLYEKCVRGQ